MVSKFIVIVHIVTSSCWKRFVWAFILTEKETHKHTHTHTHQTIRPNSELTIKIKLATNLFAMKKFPHIAIHRNSRYKSVNATRAILSLHVCSFFSSFASIYYSSYWCFRLGHHLDATANEKKDEARKKNQIHLYSEEMLKSCFALIFKARFSFCFLKTNTQKMVHS